MELSVSTIVIIVLAMSMLILGLMLIRNIFKGGTGAIESINSQVAGEINKMFGEDKRVVLYPSSGVIEVKQGKTGGFAIGIKNKLSGMSADTARFAYLVTPYDFEDCDVSEEHILSLFSGNDWKGEDLLISTEEPSHFEVFFDPAEGDPLCSVKFKIDVTYDGGKTYGTTQFKTVKFTN